MRGSRDPVFTFWDPLISRERLKIETANSARIWAAVSSNEENAKLGQKGLCGGHVTHFCNFGNPIISCERLKLETFWPLLTNLCVSFVSTMAINLRAKCDVLLPFPRYGKDPKISKVGHVTPSWPLLTQLCISFVNTPGDESPWFWEPPNISRMVKARNFKFGRDTDGSEF